MRAGTILVLVTVVSIVPGTVSAWQAEELNRYLMQ